MPYENYHTGIRRENQVLRRESDGEKVEISGWINHGPDWPLR